MKKLYFFLLAMILPVAIWAQAPSAYSLRIQNQTPWPQQCVIFGGEVCGPCASTYTSMTIMVAPMTTLSYGNSTTLGGSYPPSIPKGIVGAKILNGPAVCSPGGGTVGQPPCGLPTTYGYVTILPGCTPAGPTKAIWVPATNCQSTAQLIFQP